ncbi:hypothetical protein D7V97_11815 [Corallococcus sp. CA053C]|nr:hypothetical protein D7V97_11815 [Corallococcus sp. CA053C]
MEQTDVDFTRGVIHVRRSERKGLVTLSKGRRARQVSMTARLADALRKQRYLRGERILWRADGHPKVTQVLLNKWMSRIKRLAGLKVTGGIHILRHTFCSRLAMAGAPAMAIQELAGHQNLSTTQRYLHLSPAASQRPSGCWQGRSSKPQNENGLETFRTPARFTDGRGDRI